MDDKIIGERIKKLRTDSNINQEQLARYLGDIDQSLISRYEKGERQLSIGALEKLAALFGCTFADLTQPKFEISAVKYNFRSCNSNETSLEDIAAINQLIANLKQMNQFLKTG